MPQMRIRESRTLAAKQDQLSPRLSLRKLRNQDALARDVIRLFLYFPARIRVFGDGHRASGRSRAGGTNPAIKHYLNGSGRCYRRRLLGYANRPTRSAPDMG